MEIIEFINQDFQPDELSRPFGKDEFEAEDGSNLQEFVMDLFMEASSDWSTEEYLMALRALSNKIDIHIDSSERSLA